MSEKLILGLDIGTSSARAALYDLQGAALPGTSVKNEHAFDFTEDGGSEIDAEYALKQVIKTIDEVLRKPAARRGEIVHVASCAFWHSLVGVDDSGKPTTKVLGWADTRGGKFAQVLRKRFDEAEIHNRTGARFHSSFWPAKLLFLRNEFAESFAKTSVWLSFSDFVALRLFGLAVTSISMASGTGVFDIRSCGWDERMLRFLGIKPTGMPLVSDGPYTYRLVEKFRRRWPRLKFAEWFPSIADGAANNIGSGCTGRSQAALMIGTSGAMRVVYKGEPPDKIPSGLWCYRVDRERVILGGALSDGGGLYRWLIDNLRLDDLSQDAIATRAPGAHGLTFLPFLSGERSTGYNENATGVIAGLKMSTGPTDILQAALEAVAFRFATIFDQLNTITRVTTIVASGGAIRSSPVWAQIIADVLGKDLVLSNSEEASMRGAVLVVLETVGISLAPEVGGKTIKRNLERTRSYRQPRKRHEEIYQRLIER